MIVTERDSGKQASSPCPLKVSVRGLPIEGLTVMLRVVPDLNTRAADRIYRKMSGAGLGPYYHAAAQWGLARVESPIAARVTAETSEPVGVPDPTAHDSLTDRIMAVLFGDGVSPSVEVASEARAALDAIMAAAESLASGGDTSALDALVRSRAADIVAARDIVALEARAREAETAYLKAQEEFLAAQEAAEEARTRIAALRRQA